MQIKEIQGVQFDVLGVLENITIADSFVMPQNKVGGGNGEAKLYVGHANTELLDFFGPRGFDVSCFMLKEDLLRYLDETRTEYFYPTQAYRAKDKLSELWESRKAKVINLGEVLDFQVQDQHLLAGPRVYVNSKDVEYSLIRELSLPMISHLSIYKLQGLDTGDIQFYFQLYSDYRELIQEEEEGTDSSDSDFEPFDPMKISIDTKNISMDTLLRRLMQGTIVLNPDFQRHEVWTLKKKCQLIESLMLKIPLPMFYVAIDEESRFVVVDGLQRLSAIRDFVLGDEYLESRNEKFRGEGIALQDLEFWGDDFNGKVFNDLPVNIKNRILETEFTFTIINPGTPEDVKRNIFKRVNRGGDPLKDQEIRHALYVGKSTELLKKLAAEEVFLNATNGIKANRMLDREFILRALAFMIRDYTTYSKSHGIDSFLSDTMRIINLLPNLKFAKWLSKSNISEGDVLIREIYLLEEGFKRAMKRAEQVFDDHAFRKSYPGTRKAPVNKALFEVWTSIFSTLSEYEFANLQQRRGEFMINYINYYLKDPDFGDIISKNALKPKSVHERHFELRKFVKKYTDD